MIRFEELEESSAPANLLRAYYVLGPIVLALFPQQFMEIAVSFCR